VVFVQLVNSKIIDVNNVGTIKIIKNLTWVHDGKVIHSLELHTQKESYLKKCMFVLVARILVKTFCIFI